MASPDFRFWESAVVKIHSGMPGQLSAMDLDFAGALTVMLIPGTPLYQDFKSGKFKLPDQAGLLGELREMIAYTNLTRGYFFSNHASNLSADQDKAAQRQTKSP